MKSSIKWIVIILSCLFALSVIWMSRFTIYTTRSLDGQGMAFKLDRLTGEITILVHNQGRHPDSGFHHGFEKKVYYYE